MLHNYKKSAKKEKELS